MFTLRSTVKFHLFTEASHKHKIDEVGDPLRVIAQHIWRFGERIGVDGTTALLQGVDQLLHRHGYIARGGQAIDATPVPAHGQR